MMPRKPSEDKASWSSIPKPVAEAHIAFITQELLRHLMEGQPETQVRLNEVDGSATVEVSDGTNLEIAFPNYAGNSAEQHNNDVKEMLQAGNVRRLGALMVFGIFLNDVDFRTENLYLDSQKRLIKMGGNYRFAVSDANAPNKIFVREIGNLPYFINNDKGYVYKVNNWLWMVNDGIAGNRKDILISDKYKDLLQDEVNEAILNVLVLPTEVIKQIVYKQISNQQQADVVYQGILTKKNQLNRAVVGITGEEKFLTYLRTKTAEDQVNAYLSYLERLDPTIDTKVVFKKFETLKKYSLKAAEGAREELTAIAAGSLNEKSMWKKTPPIKSVDKQQLEIKSVDEQQSEPAAAEAAEKRRPRRGGCCSVS